MTNGGPYIAFAAFCERVLEEKDGGISLIRLIDRITAVRPAVLFGNEMPPVTHPVWLAIGLKPGMARGRHSLVIEIDKPSAQRAKLFEGAVLFEGEDRGVSVLLNLQGYVFELEGLYWFDVLLGETLLTRIPIRITYQPV